MPDLHVVVLAAGKGTRMKSGAAQSAASGSRVAPHRSRPANRGVASAGVRSWSWSATRRPGQAALGKRPGLAFVVQEPQLGTGHALLQTEPLLQGARGTLLLLSGDVPLLLSRHTRAAGRMHQSSRSAPPRRCSPPSSTTRRLRPDRPSRTARSPRSSSTGCLADRAADPRDQQRHLRVRPRAAVRRAAQSIGSTNAQGEYYLPDLVRDLSRARAGRSKRSTSTIPDEIRGVNSRTELADVAAILRRTKNDELMAAGVTLVDPATTYIDPDVTVGADTVIHPGVYLEGRTRIGAGCEIHAGVAHRQLDARRPRRRSTTTA